MEAFRIEATVSERGAIQLENLPFRAGTNLEVILLERQPEQASENRYPLRGTVLKYEDPFEPVGEEDWEALK